jgi:hypothetical protein
MADALIFEGLPADKLLEILYKHKQELATLREQLATAKAIIESDRSAIADGVTKLRQELDSRFWLTEGRGSYGWDDDRYREEFLVAGQALLKAMEPLKKIAADLKNSPKTTIEVIEARRNLRIERDQARAELMSTIAAAMGKEEKP